MLISNYYHLRIGGDRRSKEQQEERGEARSCRNSQVTCIPYIFWFQHSKFSVSVHNPMASAGASATRCSIKASIPAHAHERCARAATVLKLGNSGILILFGLPPTPTCVEFPPLVGGDLNLELLEGRRVLVSPQPVQTAVFVPGCPHFGACSVCDFDFWIMAGHWGLIRLVRSPQHLLESHLHTTEESDSDCTSTTAEDPDKDLRDGIVF